MGRSATSSVSGTATGTLVDTENGSAGIYSVPTNAGVRLNWKTGALEYIPHGNTGGNAFSVWGIFGPADATARRVRFDFTVAPPPWNQADIAVTIPLPGAARADNIFSGTLAAVPGATGSTTYDVVITSNPVNTALNSRSVNAPGGSPSVFDGLNFGDGEDGRMDDRRIEVHQGAIPGVYGLSYQATDPARTITFNMTLVPQAWEQDDISLTIPASGDTTLVTLNANPARTSSSQTLQISTSYTLSTGGADVNDSSTNGLAFLGTANEPLNLTIGSGATAGALEMSLASSGPTGTVSFNLTLVARINPLPQDDIAVTIPLPGVARADNIFSDALTEAMGATGSTTYDVVITSNPVHTALNGRSVNAPGGSPSTFDALNFGDGEDGRMDDRRIEVHQGAIPGVYGMEYISSSPDLTTPFNMTLIPQVWAQDDVRVTLPTANPITITLNANPARTSSSRTLQISTTYILSTGGADVNAASDNGLSFATVGDNSLPTVTISSDVTAGVQEMSLATSGPTGMVTFDLNVFDPSVNNPAEFELQIGGSTVSAGNTGDILTVVEKTPDPQGYENTDAFDSSTAIVWVRGNPGEFTAIAGATTVNYTLATADEGRDVRARVTNIDTATLKKLLEDDPNIVLIDVRTEREANLTGGTIRAKRNVIIYLGDGGTTCPGADPSQYAQTTLTEVKSKNSKRAQINSIHVGTDDSSFSKQLATQNGGTFTQITR